VSAALVLAELVRRDVQVRLEGGKLKVSAPGGTDTQALRVELLAQKEELLEYLRKQAASPVIIDFETRSLASLRKVGGRRYARHPSTEALCMVARMPDGALFEWKKGDATPDMVLDAVRSGVPVLAHNALGFDRFIWQLLGWPPATWIDTMKLASLAGLPRGLDALAEQLLGKAKDAAGRRVTLQLSRPGKDGKLRLVTPELMAAVIAYCREDVALLAEVWHVRLGNLRDVEAEVRALDQVVNDRGFQFDVELAKAIIEAEAHATAAMFQTTGIAPTTVRSGPKLRAALAEQGVLVDNIRRETLEPLLASELLAPGARGLIEARVTATGITTSKLQAALDRIDDDGRLRDAFVYHAAHTARWSGRGFQPQNLPHGAKNLDVEAAVSAVLARDHDKISGMASALKVNVSDVTAKLVRACVRASTGKVLAVVDYASVEPRGLAWMAGNLARLKDFRDGADIYKPMASKILGVPVDKLTKEQRNIGKPPELGCGYGMGGQRFGEYGEGFGIDWSTMPMTPKQVVEMWRDANPLVAGVRVGGVGARQGGLWQKLESAALRACVGERVTVACTVWQREGDDVVCQLPSGRKMVYRAARIEPRETSWGTQREAMTYAHHDNGRSERTPTYGGLLTENVIQTICRDVLADALLRLDRAGFQVVMHVHDEVVAEVDEPARFEEMKAIMTVPPTWANGLPLAVEGYWGPRYRGK
jgi:DNA polymerase